jgi:hypothetical protein
LEEQNKMMELSWKLNSVCASLPELAGMIQSVLDQEMEINELIELLKESEEKKHFLCNELKRTQASLGDFADLLNKANKLLVHTASNLGGAVDVE